MPQLRVFCSDFCLTDYPRIDPSRELEGRLSAAPHFSPTRASDRGAYLCRLHGLLPARDLASPVAPARPRPDPTCRSGQVCRHPDARCALPNDRRPHSDFEPLHPSRTRSKILLEQLKLTLPAQPPPRISSRRKLLDQI